MTEMVRDDREQVVEIVKDDGDAILYDASTDLDEPPWLSIDEAQLIDAGEMR